MTLDASAIEKWLPAHLPAQRWYAGTDEPSTVAVDELEVISEDPALVWAIVTADGVTYQLFLGVSDTGEPFDALGEPALALTVLGLVTDGKEAAHRVRPMGAEQSNTSLVYDDRIALKVYRRIADGPNPDVELTTALATHGFANVAPPVAAWQRDGRDLAIAQRYLAGGAEGWALALTSLRDLCLVGGDPAEAGGDFAGEAERLGRLTAELHLALGRAFGARRSEGPADWVAGLGAQIAAAGLTATAAPFLERLDGLVDTGALVRVHGDYHLGQVLRVDAGWFVLDFEGEPARPLADRRLPASPLKDVTGMLRSFHYASAVAASQVAASEVAASEAAASEAAAAWEQRNRGAFLDGYLGTPGIADLLPADPASLQLVLDALELEKAVYELGYERAHRPDWVHIPQAAIGRLLIGGAPGG